MVGQSQNRRGTTVRFRPDPEIFGENPRFQPARLFRMARSKAYLYRGVKIRWRCDAALLKPGAETPAEADLHFPGGPADFLAAATGERATVVPEPFVGPATLPAGPGRVGWARPWASRQTVVQGTGG